jgi:hypothetical protein
MQIRFTRLWHPFQRDEIVTVGERGVTLAQAQDWIRSGVVVRVDQEHKKDA